MRFVPLACALPSSCPRSCASTRGPLGPLAGHPLDDPVSQLFAGDVRLALGRALWDVVLLDVDNGPASFTMPDNARLYDARGLERIREALAPRGVVVILSRSRTPTSRRASPAPASTPRCGAFERADRSAKGRPTRSSSRGASRVGPGDREPSVADEADARSAVERERKEANERLRFIPSDAPEAGRSSRGETQRGQDDERVVLASQTAGAGLARCR